MYDILIIYFFMTTPLIADPIGLEQKLSRIVADGEDHFHVIADFDRTLTKAFVAGKQKSSLESIIADEGYLGAEFTKQSAQNFATYYPIEIDPEIPLEQKKAAMKEWREIQFDLMLHAGLTKDILSQAMKSETIKFREWYNVFFDMLQRNDIPLLIFSASGLWYDAISYCLENEKIFTDNIDIISNAFIRNEEGRATGVKEPIIHVFNKGETVIHDLPVYQKIKQRKNILLLGDSLGDIHMADGFDYANIIKIWFLNNDTPELKKKFLEVFDVVITGDGDMTYITALLSKLFS